MPTKNPRINVVCEPPLYYEIAHLAEDSGASLSAVASDLIREALELREDRSLATLADQRAATFDQSNSLSFDQVFGK